MSEESKIAGALAKAQSQFKPLKKDKEANAGKFKYKYASLDACIAATQPALNANNLAVTQVFGICDGQTILITYLLHSSGERLRSELPINVQQQPQQFGSNLTYWKRYAYCAMLNLAADEDDDGQMAQHAPQQTAQQKPQQSNKGTRKLTEKQIKRLYAIAKANGFTREVLYDHLDKVYGKDHMSDLTKGEYDEFCSTLEGTTHDVETGGDVP